MLKGWLIECETTGFQLLTVPQTQKVTAFGEFIFHPLNVYTLPKLSVSIRSMVCCACITLDLFVYELVLLKTPLCESFNKSTTWVTGYRAKLNMCTYLLSIRMNIELWIHSLTWHLFDGWTNSQVSKGWHTLAWAVLTSLFIHGSWCLVS